MIDTSRVKGILSAIKAGYGFKNIASPSVTKLTSIAIPDVQTLLAMATTQSAASGTPIPTEAALTAARNTIIAAQQQATAYAAHVSGISGVNLIGEPNFITMAKTAQAARDIDGVKSCDPVLQVFGSIQRAAVITNSVSTFADSVETFLDNIPNTIDTIQPAAVLLTNTMSKQIVDDNNAYIKAKLTVAQFSAAANLTSIYEDECLNGILMSIMTDRLKTEVVKASEAAKKKNTSSIFDEDSAIVIDDSINTNSETLHAPLLLQNFNAWGNTTKLISKNAGFEHVVPNYMNYGGGGWTGCLMYLYFYPAMILYVEDNPLLPYKSNYFSDSNLAEAEAVIELNQRIMFTTTSATITGENIIIQYHPLEIKFSLFFISENDDYSIEFKNDPLTPDSQNIIWKSNNIDTTKTFNKIKFVIKKVPLVSPDNNTMNKENSLVGIGSLFITSGYFSAI